MAEDNEQLALDIPVPIEFPSFDDVPDDEAEAQLPGDSFDPAAVSVEESESGCCAE